MTPSELRKLESENVSLSVELPGIDADARLKNAEVFVRVR
jgi:hypothetical protein